MDISVTGFSFAFELAGQDSLCSGDWFDISALEVDAGLIVSLSRDSSFSAHESSYISSINFSFLWLYKIRSWSRVIVNHFSRFSYPFCQVCQESLW